MRVAIIQMSDLHISAESDYIVSHSSKIALAVSSIVNTCDKAILVVTGDIIDRGNTGNYAFAKSFFQDFTKKLDAGRALLNWEYIIVPGNHDLDFEMPVSFRSLVIGDCLEKGSFECDDHIREALKPQKEFWSFYSSLIGSQIDPCISFEKKINISENQKLVFHCYNTAVLSTKEEQPQSLIVPNNSFLKYDNNEDGNDIVFSVYHHKTGWLSTKSANNNQRAFSDFIQKNSQVLMCGHEHQKDQKRIENLANKDQVLYLESDSMQQGDNQSFTVLVIDSECPSCFRKTDILINAVTDNITLSEEQELAIPRHHQAFPFSEEHLKYLNSISAPIVHPRKKDLTLDDIFVYQDLEPQVYTKEDRLLSYIDSQNLLTSCDPGNVIVLEGDNQCGKTSLLKMLSMQCYLKGVFPILLRGTDIKDVHLSQHIEKAYKKQYDAKQQGFDKYLQLEKNQRIVLIDGIDKSALNNVGLDILWKELIDNYGLVVATSSPRLDLKKMLSQKAPDYSILSYYIQPLGYMKRNELIEKWVLLGSDEYTRNENDVLDTVKSIYDHIETVLGKELLPPNPIFILTLLQAMDSSIKPVNVSPSSYANLYQSLLFSALLGTGVPQDKLSGVETFLSELSFQLYKAHNIQFAYDNINDSRVNYSSFYDTYSRSRIVSYKKEDLKDLLINSRLWVEVDENVYIFSYKYLYYYLTAQKISDLINSKDKELGVKEVISLCSDLHKEENANILIFLAYLDKSKTLLEEIRISSLIPFEKLAPITLNTDDPLYGKLNELLGKMGKDVLKTYVDPKKSRENILKKHDDETRAIREASSSSATPTLAEIEKNSGLKDFIDSIMIVRIMGQIVKNQKDTLFKDELSGLVEDAYNTTFRSITHITELIEQDYQGFVEEFANNTDKYKSADIEKIKARIADLLHSVLLKISLLSFSNLALSVGVSGSDMCEIYDKVSSKLNSPAADFITFTIKTYYGRMNINDLRTLVGRYERNPVMLRLINSRVRSYVYNHNLPTNKMAEIGSITKMQLIDTPAKQLAQKRR